MDGLAQYQDNVILVLVAWFPSGTAPYNRHECALPQVSICPVAVART